MKWPGPSQLVSQSHTQPPEVPVMAPLAVERSNTAIRSSIRLTARPLHAYDDYRLGANPLEDNRPAPSIFRTAHENIRRETTWLTAQPW